MPEHNVITDPEIHEPKGVASASANKVYASDGVGSGNWSSVYLQGVEDYNDSGGSQSLSTSFVDLTNDGGGANTNKTYQLPGHNDIWDTSNNEFDWNAAGLELGDVVLIRFDFTVTTASTNNEITVALDLAHGDASEFQLELYRNNFKTAGTYNINFMNYVYIGSSTILGNPCKVVMKSDDASDTVVVNGWAVTTLPRNPVYN